MAIKTKPFDAAKYFDTPEAQARLISEALRDGDSGFIAAAIGTVARARGISEIATETGLNRQALYSGLKEGGNPTLDTILRVLRPLNIQLTAIVREPEGKAA